MIAGPAQILAIAVIKLLTLVLPATALPSQEKYPDPPADLTRIYYLSGDKTLTALPFEPGLTSINVFKPAERDKIERVLIKGRSATTVLLVDEVEFFVFVGDRMDPPPHQLVRLSGRNSDRVLPISVIRGQRGYAPFAIDNVALERNLIERLRVEAGPRRILFVNYMRLRPRGRLTPGEYAIIGDSLADIATFRVE
jgi:hypothetical protein